MGFMTGTGPLGRQPAGRFNFEPPAPGKSLYLEPTPKRIRVVVGDEIVADSRRATMLHESGQQPIYYFPPEDVRMDLLEPSDRRTHCPKKGDASYYTIRAGDSVVADGAWYYPEPIAGAPSIKDLIAFYWNRMDHWFEEAEEVFGHPRDPYHRLDIRRSDRNVRVSLDGARLAETTRAMALFESNLPTRWYMPAEDIVAELEPSEKTTFCPYKGTASYCSVRLPSGDVAEDLSWTYTEPFPEALPVQGLLCFFNERVDLELDAELQERPESPWSHGVKDASQNAPVAQTRG
jgi:uncharacterized protein (DUF427 family)